MMSYLESLQGLPSAVLAKASVISLIVFDVDGVLTDGFLHFTSEGEQIKRFQVKDGVGLKLLSDMGISVAVVSAKSSSMLDRRMKELGVEHYFSGVKDKASCVQTLMKQIGLSPEQCAFVGDDMVDLPAMNVCGLSFAPMDAYAYVLESVDHICPVRAGQGVARYVCDVLLVAKGKYQTAYKIASTPNFERGR